MINVWARTLPELEDIFKKNGFPRYRAKQLRDYLYKRFIFDFTEMKQLAKGLENGL